MHAWKTIQEEIEIWRLPQRLKQKNLKGLSIGGSKWVKTPTDPGVLSYLKTRGGAKKAPPEVSGFFWQFGSGFLKF